MSETTEQPQNVEADGVNHYYSEQYLELQKEPVLYEWEIERQRRDVWLVSGIVGGVFILMWLCTSLSADRGGFFSGNIFFLVIGVVTALQNRYLFAPNQLYHYRMTAKGIYYTQQDKIPEVAYTIARGIGGLLIVGSIIAVGLVGPLALAGAGAGAFLAFKITNMKPRVFHSGCQFKGYGELSIFRDVYGIKIREMPRDTGQYGIVLTHKEDYERVLNDLARSLPDYQITEAESRKEFGY
ncbi:hypothetical protein [Aeromonas sp.]|uniref:hypothetical protein n=1 Tax=Aeromonas sp. TaxID=647 RepID=UPI00258F5F57|nr:hypothetical protein [Aeromonas sp.]MCX7129060.1 hypothetical protein [Aeromonas sp.]